IFTNIPVACMVNFTNPLPMPTEESFVLQEVTWNVPTYEKIDDWITELAERGLLSCDPVIGDVLEGKPVNMSVRTVQRHFAKTIGISPRCVKQILCARKAVEL